MQAFTEIKIRVASIIINGDKILLIRKTNNESENYTLPGGNVEHAEDIKCGIFRELKEELNILEENISNINLIAIQDQMISRPGKTPPPRKIHFIFRVEINKGAIKSIPTYEYDDLYIGENVWVDISKIPELQTYPSIKNLDFSVMNNCVLLNPINDLNFIWI